MDKNFDLSKVSTGDRGRDEIVKCIIQLAERSGELNHIDLKAMLYTVAGACLDNSSTILCGLMREYSAMRMIMDELDASQEKYDNDKADEEKN